MKYNGKNIITDQDITLTGNGHQGENLSDVLSNQEDRISDLEGNIKWIYKYGGIGSGTGSGGSGSSSSGWRAVITRADTGQILTDGVQLNFPDIGDYSLRVQIPKGGGTSVFNVVITYTNASGSQRIDESITYDTKFIGTYKLTLNQNGTISIVISNLDTGDFVTYSIPYIVSPYKFNLRYVYADDHSEFTPNNNIIFMEDVRTKGLLAALDSTVSVGINSVSFSWVDWKGVSHTSEEIEETIQEKSSTIIYLPLCDNINEFLSDSSNAKFYQFSLSIDIILEGNVEKENLKTLTLGDNLVPRDMYLKVVSDKGLYDTSQLEIDSQGQIKNNYPKDGQYTTGSVAFRVTPFHGSLKPTRSYTLMIYVNGVLATPQGVKIFDQQEKSVSIAISDYGEKLITFSLSEDSVTKEFKYYIYVKETISSFSWYPRDTAERFSTVENSYFRQYNSCSNISGLTKDSNISMTVNSKKQEHNLTLNGNPLSTYDTYDQFLSIGIQYSSINDLEKPICSFSLQNSLDQAIVIYQNKVLLSDRNPSDVDNVTGSDCEIFLPMVDRMEEGNMDGYHLINIYKKLEKKEGTNYWKGIYVYIDGVLEGAFGSFVTTHQRFEKVSFYPGNYYINLIESSCILHQPTTSSAKKWMSDHDILGYFYTYDALILKHELDSSSPEGERIINLYEAFGELEYDDDNFVIAKESTIRNIAKNSEAPVLLMTFIDDNGKVGHYSGYNRDNFKDWMSEHYEEDQGETLSEFPVTISWSGGHDDLKPVSLSPDAPPAQFWIKPQGSSTLGYRCKNWELYAPHHAQEGYSYIYSPNFVSVDNNTSDEAKEEAYKSFLPEESFTLKADVVDSSHTNNNAIGNFVNSITKKFDAAAQSGKYSAYIKNCLTGFPILLFLRTRYKVSAESTSTDQGQYYFLGIYNFNLGRKSYFNLGYKNTSSLESVGLRDGFNIYSISDDDNTINPGVVVAEVQGNDRFFDFSQYDDTILFKFSNDANDKTYMFGDLVYGERSDTNAKAKIKDFVSKVSDAGGYIFRSIGKTFSTSEADDEYGYKDPYSAVDANGVPKNRVPNNKFQAVRRLDGSTTKYDFHEISFPANQAQSLQELIEGADVGGGNLQRGLDFNALCEYYTICMAFGLVDSVQKNLNIKTWNADAAVPKFYPAFYDMDTCLGVSNSGSKISYFAFSDYWTSGIDANGRLLAASVYRDYSPKRREGEDEESSQFYDVPSSFLFAIAKYGWEVLGRNGEYTASVPNNLWGNWRSGVGNVTDKTRGCLESAKKFISDYYRDHLSTIDTSAYNFNYKYKYFFKTSDGHGFDSLNFPKFYGRKLYYTEDWLNGRFHILDAYFNINRMSDKLTPSDYSAPYTEDIYKNMAAQNDDVYVLHDIFSVQKIQYANLDYNVLVSSRPYAPLILDGANHSSRYIFPEDGRQVTVNLSTSGNQALTIGGSALWTDLSTINPFITADRKIRVHSKYFTTLNGTSGVCSSWDIEAPSLRKVSLVNNRFYSGKLSFVKDDSNLIGFPNLSEVNISGTALELVINSCPVNTVRAEGMVGGGITIANVVGNFESLSLYGKIKDLIVPAWKKDIVLPTNYTPGSTTARLDCGTIDITSNFPDATLLIANNADLEKLTASGFKTITILNCPKLKEVHIQGETNILEELNISGDSSSADGADTFKIGSNDGEVSLSSQTNLKRLKLSNLKMTSISLPSQNLNFLPGAFDRCSNLTTISGSGTYYITGPNTFKDCINFTFNSSLKLKIAQGVTDISRTFYIGATTDNTKGKIGLDTAEYFLKTCCKPDAGVATSVTNINELFLGQNITYGKSELLVDYPNKTSRLSFENFDKVSSFYYVFYNNPVTAWNRYMFGPNNTGRAISVSTLLGNVSSLPTTTQSGYRVVYATTDFLYEIIENLSSIALINYNLTGTNYCFIDSSGTALSEVKLDDIFSPTDSTTNIKRTPKILTSMSSFEFWPNHTFDFSNMFNSGWAAAKSSGISISTCFWYLSYPNIKSGSLESLLRPVKIRSIDLFLRYTGYTGEVDMSNFIDWTTIKNTCTNLFYSGAGYESLGFKKRVTGSKFLNIWNYILNAGNQLTGVAYLFSSCAIINWEEREFSLVSSSNKDTVNTTIRYTAALFRDCWFWNAAQGEEDVENPSAHSNKAASIGITVTHDFLKPLPNLVSAFYDFKGMKWNNPVPFDFFNKRVLSSSVVWIIDESKFNATSGTTITNVSETSTPRYEVTTLEGVDGSSYRHRLLFDGEDGRPFYRLSVVGSLGDDVIGTSTTEITDGSTTDIITIEGEPLASLVPGTTVIYNDNYFIWIGDSWKFIGNIDQNIEVGTSIKMYYSASKTYYLRNGVVYIQLQDDEVDDSEIIKPINYSDLVQSGITGSNITNLGLYKATMNTYSYNVHLTSIYGCFQDILISDSGTVGFDKSADYNKGSFIKNNIIVNGLEHTRYYSNLSDAFRDSKNLYILNRMSGTYSQDYPIRPLTLTQGTEITDCDGIQGNYTQSFTIKLDNGTRGVENYSGFDKDHLFTAPDVLYGVAAGASIENLFNGSSMSGNEKRFSGMIPDHLIPDRIKSVSIRGVLSGLNIVPKLAYTVTSMSEYGGEETHNIYCFVPSNFTKYNDLSNTFNFRLLLPGNSLDHYFLFSNDSLPDTVTSLANSIPDTSYDRLVRQEAGWPTTCYVDPGTRFNLMQTPNKIGNDYAMPYEGLDLSKFTNLKLDYLIGNGLALYMSGPLFRTGTINMSSWNRNKYLADPANGYVIYAGFGDYGGISAAAEIDFPANNDNFLRVPSTNQTSCWINKNSVTNFASINTAQYPGVRFV